ncbi:MAG TPA: hypothetical protein H9683_02955 [Firmicutes bacterium]|nr:hypothetical protein [Bacillota bacterium]
MKVTKILLIGLFSAFFDSSDNRKKERRLTIIGLLEWLLLIANFCVLTFAIEISWWISLIMTIGVYLLLILIIALIEVIVDLCGNGKKRHKPKNSIDDNIK